MVRLNDSTALQILLLLGVIRARTPKDYTLRSAGLDFTEAVRDNTEGAQDITNDTAKTLLSDAVYRSTKGDWIDAKVEQLVNVLATATKESMEKVNEDRNLIDELAEALRLPFPENRLGHINVERIQKLILTPSELKEAERSLDASMACPNCGHQFRSGEVVTVRSWDRGHRDVIVFTCTACNSPSYTRCSHDDCENYVDIGKARLGKANYCPDHASAKSIHEPNDAAVKKLHEDATKEIEDANALRDARDRATRVRFVVDPNAPPTRGGGARTFRYATNTPITIVPDGGIQAGGQNLPNAPTVTATGAGPATADTGRVIQNLRNLQTFAGIFDETAPIQYAPAPAYLEDDDVPEIEDDDDGGF